MMVLDLFSGIGGFSLGLERAGMKTVAFCEIEPFPRAVLAKHWPGVPIYEDVCSLTGAGLASAGIVPDAICGGFPCQDISVAGKGAGLDGERSGLWHEYRRLIGEIRPRWVIIENVAALRNRGLDTVLGGLSALGYDAEWHVISAAALGAPHIRERVWIVAYPARDGDGRARLGIVDDGAGGRGAFGQRADGAEDMGHADHAGRGEPGEGEARRGECGKGWGMDRAAGGLGDALANSERSRFEGRDAERNGTNSALSCGPVGGPSLAYPSSAGLPRPERPERREPLISAADIGRAVAQCSWGRAQRGMGGEVDGVSAGVDRTRPVEAWEGNTPRTVGRGALNRRPRVKALGNAVVPQIPELIGRAIMRAEGLQA